MKPMDAYIRVSRVGGREGDGYHSPSVQEDEIRRWADRERVTVARVDVEEDVSGKVPIDRRKLGALVRRAEQGVTSGIVVYDATRFARNLLEGKTAIERLRAVGARLADTRGNDSIRNPLAIDIYLVIAEDQLRNLTAQWERYTGRAVAQGKHVAAKAPLGYLRSDETDPRYDEKGRLSRDARLVPDPRTSALVREAFEARVSGASLLAVAKTLGVSKSHARYVLTNRAYLGEARGPNGVALQGAHEPVVSEELFAAAGQTFAGRGRRTRWARRVEPAGYFSGVIVCAGCGHKLRDVNAGAQNASYACVGRYSGGDCPAPAAALIRAVDDYVVSLIEDEGMDRKIIAVYYDRRARWEAARNAVVAAEEKLNRAVRNTLEMTDEALARQVIRECEEERDAALASFYALDAPAPEDEQVDAAWRAVIASVTLGRADPKRRRWQPISERVKVTWAVPEDQM